MYRLTYLFIASIILLSGCTSVNYNNAAYAKHSELDSIMVPPRPSLRQEEDINSTDYQERYQQWKDTTDRDF